MIQNPDLMKKIMESAATQYAEGSMPPSLLGIDPAASQGVLNKAALNASLEGGMPAGFMEGNVQPTFDENGFNQAALYDSLGVSQPAPEPKMDFKGMANRIAAMQVPEIQHHALAQSNAQYVPLPQSDLNPYASAADNMGLMELMARARQTA